jgi:hypothetical protein
MAVFAIFLRAMELGLHALAAVVCFGFVAGKTPNECFQI